MCMMNTNTKAIGVKVIGVNLKSDLQTSGALAMMACFEATL